MKTFSTNLVKSIFIAFLLALSCQMLAQIQSTPAGGDWTTVSTWIGGVPPAITDDVVINGLVNLNTNTSCNNITISVAGTLQNKSNSNWTLTINGNITNQGTIQNNYYSLTLNIFGNIYNNKTWLNQYTNLVSATDQDVWSSQAFQGANFTNTISTKNINITSSTISFLGCNVNMGNGNMVFGTGGLIITGNYFTNAVITANQLDITSHGGAYLQNVSCNANHALLRGVINLMNGVVFNDNTTTVVVEIVDTLQNRSSSNYTLTVNGDLHNNGLIRNNYYNLTIDISGSIVNNALWQNTYTNLMGTGNQNLSFNQAFNGINFTSNKLIGTTTALTPLRFIGTAIDFNSDTLSMGTGNDSIFLNGGHLQEITLLAAAAPFQVYCHQSNSSWFVNVNIESNDAVLAGVFQYMNAFSIMGNARVEGTLQNRSSGNYTATILGNITNNGIIQNNYYNCFLDVTGDIYQNGTWANYQTSLTGGADQALTFTSVFNGNNLINSNNNGKVISNSTLSFNNTIINFNYDTLMFANAADSLIINSQYFKNGVITKAGSKTPGFLNCTQTGNAYFRDVSIVAANIDLGGIVQFFSPMSFTGHVTVSGTLQNLSSGNYEATIVGNLTNNGTIQNNYYNNTLYITGDINQNGIWANYQTFLSGDANQNLSFTTDFSGTHLINSNNIGKVISNSTLSFNNTIINFNYDTLMFANAADSLIINGQYFMNGVITKEGSKTPGFLNCTQTGNAYFRDVSIVAANIDLGGIVQFFSPMSFTGHVTVSGTLQNLSSGNYEATIVGNLTNNGTIQNNYYNNTLYITGDISQNGIWSNYYNYLSGSVVQNLSQTAAFSCNRIVDTDPASAVNGSSDLIFQNTDVDLGGATLVMKDHSNLSVQDAWIINGTITSNFYDLSMTGSSYLQNMTLNNATIYQWVQVKNGCVFSGTTTVEGTLSNSSSGSYTLNIAGDIHNNGNIQNNYYSIYMNVDGDVYNNGSWGNAWTQLNGYAGSVSQTINLQNGHSITGQIRLYSQAATSYEWYWNGISLNPHPDFTGELSQVLVFSVPVTSSYSGIYNCLTNLGWSRNISITTSSFALPEIALTVMLQGPFNGTDMNNDLNAGGTLPLNEPYNTVPWNYWGSESVSSIPNGNVVDWVYLDYRDAVDAASATPATIVDRQAALLLNDGSVVGLDGVSNLFFSGTVVNNLYVVIHHRNHLDIMSAIALTESSGVYAYDFTTLASQAFGGNQNDLGGGIYGMIGGDANADGIINEYDGIESWRLLVGQTGYLPSDATLNAQVSNQDKNDIWLPNYGKTEVLP